MPVLPTSPEVIPSPPTRTTSKSSSSSSEDKTTRIKPSSLPPTPVHSPTKKLLSAVTSKAITSTTTSPASSRVSAVSSCSGSGSTSAKDIAASVTARLSRPKRPSGVTRHLSNASLPNGPNTPPSSNTNSASVEDTCGSLTTTRHKTTARLHSNGTVDVVHKPHTPVGGFVRGSTTRSTMPASVARTHKKQVVDARKERTSGSAVGVDEAPAPPRRSTSIRSKPPITTTTTQEPAKQQISSAPSSASKTDKSMAGFINRLSSPKKKVEHFDTPTKLTTSSKSTTPSKTPTPTRSKPVNPRMRSSTSSDGDKSFFKKIIDKRKSTPQVPLNIAPSASQDARHAVSKC